MTDVFNEYAAYYDLLYQDKPYKAEAAYIETLIRKYKSNAEFILELGCGTGVHAAELAQRGFFIQGIDFSKPMIEKAKSRKSSLPEETSKRVNFEYGDVRSYQESHGVMYDIAISLFHVFSYQITNEDLAATFNTAAQNLKPGGLLIFDYWYGPAVLKDPPKVSVKEFENTHNSVSRIAEPTLYPKENRVKVNIALQMTNKANNCVTNILESHNMRYLFIPEILFLSRNQFCPIAHFSWMTVNPPDHDNWTAVSILKRLQ